MTIQTTRSIYLIAADIASNWKNVNFAAKPYLSAMYSLDNINSNYCYDSADSIIRYFLSNASSFKGDKARELKNELRSIIGMKSIKAPKKKVKPIQLKKTSLNKTYTGTFQKVKINYSTIQKYNYVTIKGKVLKDLFSNLADQTKRKNYMPALDFLKLEINKRDISLISTDGYALKVNKFLCNNDLFLMNKENFSYLIAGNIISKLKQFIKSNDDIKIYSISNYLYFVRSDNKALKIINNHDFKYPDYNRVINNSRSKYYCTIDKKELIDLLKTSKDLRVKINFNDNYDMTLLINELPYKINNYLCNTWNDLRLNTFLLNRKYLLSILKNFKTKQVQISFDNSNITPLEFYKFNDKNNIDYYSLLMPIRQ